MLALVLFAVGTVAAVELIQRAQAGINDGENVLTATLLAQRRLEELHNASYANLDAQAGTENPVSGFSAFGRTITVTPMTTTPPYNTAHLKQVAVRVYWNSPGGQADVTLQTLRSSD